MIVRQLVTAEQLWELPNPSGRQRELIDGEVVDVSPTTMWHGIIVAKVARIIGDYVESHHLGIVAAGDVGYVLHRGPDQVRAPDVSFIAREDMPESGFPERGFWEGWPTLAIEVVSPDDKASEVHAKVHQFLEAGTKQVWVLWPDRQSVTVHDQDGARELGPDAQLDGGDTLPGFSVRVGDLFEVSLGR